MNTTSKIGWQLNQSYLELSSLFYKKTMPTPVSSPTLLLLNETLCKDLKLNPLYITPDYLSGNTILPGTTPIAQAYAGHQFGYFTMLGDGRAILLGEQEGYDIQLKGAGQTAYSRRGDGRATLSSMIREYIISESMYHLNIPTTRSLAVVLTGDKVYREEAFPGGILTRVSKSHIRVGTFQFAATKGPDFVRSLADYTIKRLYPETMNADNPYLDFLNAVMINQAKLIAYWQSIGFIHGVMNTDNMSISGETIDYGPCAFIDEFNENKVFSSIDSQGRYAYRNQPVIATWNLARLAETLLFLIHEDEQKAIEIVEHMLKGFYSIYEDFWLSCFRNKLGLTQPKEDDRVIIEDLLRIMNDHHLDFTNTFATLSQGEIPQLLEEWSIDWLKCSVDYALMKKVNPWVIPRNHQVDKVLKSADMGNYKPLKELLNIISRPYDYSNIQIKYTLPPNDSERVTQTFCGT